MLEGFLRSALGSLARDAMYPATEEGHFDSGADVYFPAQAQQFRCRRRGGSDRMLVGGVVGHPWAQPEVLREYSTWAWLSWRSKAPDRAVVEALPLAFTHPAAFAAVCAEPARLRALLVAAPAIPHLFDAICVDRQAQEALVDLLLAAPEDVAALFYTPAILSRVLGLPRGHRLLLRVSTAAQLPLLALGLARSPQLLKALPTDHLWGVLLQLPAHLSPQDQRRLLAAATALRPWLSDAGVACAEVLLAHETAPSPVAAQLWASLLAAGLGNGSPLHGSPLGDPRGARLVVALLPLLNGSQASAFAAGLERGLSTWPRAACQVLLVRRQPWATLLAVLNDPLPLVFAVTLAAVRLGREVTAGSSAVWAFLLRSPAAYLAWRAWVLAEGTRTAQVTRWLARAQHALATQLWKDLPPPQRSRNADPWAKTEAVWHPVVVRRPST